MAKDLKLKAREFVPVVPTGCTTAVGGVCQIVVATALLIPTPQQALAQATPLILRTTMHRALHLLVMVILQEITAPMMVVHMVLTETAEEIVSQIAILPLITLPVIGVLLLAIIVPILPLAQCQVLDLNQLPLVSVLEVFTGCLIQEDGVWLMDPLMYRVVPHIIQVVALLQVLRLQEGIIAAASLLIQVPANVKTEPAQEDLTGTASNVDQPQPMVAVEATPPPGVGQPFLLRADGLVKLVLLGIKLLVPVDLQEVYLAAEVGANPLQMVAASAHPGTMVLALAEA